MDQLRIVVAGHEDELAIGPEPRPDRTQDRRGENHHRSRPALQQLDDIAEQHEPIHVVELRQQPLQRLGVQQDVVAKPGSQVEV